VSDLRTKLESRKARRAEPLEVPEWEQTVYLRCMSAQDQIDLSEGTAPAQLPVKILLHCLVDENGERLLGDDDFALLAGEDFPVIMRIFGVAAKLNGLSSKELDEAMATFDTARSESGPSASPLLSAVPSMNSEKSPALS
jgi:hypothetical protein